MDGLERAMHDMAETDLGGIAFYDSASIRINRLSGDLEEARLAAGMMREFAAEILDSFNYTKTAENSKAYECAENICHLAAIIIRE